MLEVCFGDSCAGLLKIALRSSQVVSLTHLLDLGKISGDLRLARRNFLDKFFYCTSKRMRRKLEKDFFDNVDRVVDAAKEGDTIRIWHADTASDECGLLMLASLLKDCDCDMVEVHVRDTFCVTMLDYIEVADNCDAWTKPITKDRIEQLDRQWQRLIAEDGELRILENGEIKTVGEDYFDDYILQKMPTQDTINRRALVGTVLGTSKHYLHDDFVDDRIEALIENNEIIDVGTLRVLGDEIECLAKKQAATQELLDKYKRIEVPQLGLSKDEIVIDVYLRHIEHELSESFLDDVKENRYEEIENCSLYGDTKEREEQKEQWKEICRKKYEKCFGRYLGKGYDTDSVKYQASFGRKKVYIDFCMDYGDISHTCDGHGADLVEAFFDSRRPYWRECYFDDEELREKYIDDTCQAYCDLVSHLMRGGTCRIWHGDNISDMCNFAFLIYKLRNIKCNIIDVELPNEFRDLDGNLCRYDDWAQLSSEDMLIPFASNRVMTQAEREKVEKIWENTVARGDLLRVNHGRIVNVPISYYDGIIMELSNKKRKFRIKELIGKIYDNLYGEDMCDETVLVDRLYDMIDREIFEVVDELPNSQYPYDMIIKRGKNFDKA